MKVIDKRQLGQLSPLGQGGMGQVFRVAGTVPGLPSPLVYKEPLAGLDASTAQQMIEAMRYAVSLRDAMSAADLAELDALTTWPLAVVQHQGRDAGIVMRLIDSDFFIAAKGGPRVFEFDLLGASDTQIRALGIDRSAADGDLVRLALIARLAYVMEIVHRARGNHRFVYGDLNLRNVAIATDPPRVLLMDCDGVVDLNDAPRAQPNTPFFVPPEITSKSMRYQDQATDVYKLGLCVIRGLAIGRGVTQLYDPASRLMIAGLLDQVGIDLIQRAVGADRGNRPTAEEIKEYLVGRVMSLAEPPQLHAASLSRTVTIRGSDTLVRWSQVNGKQVRIYGVNGFEVRNIVPDAHPNGYAIQPPTSGPIYVEVSNEDGSDELLAGCLDYYELPEIDFAAQLRGRLPRLVLPDLPEVAVPEVYAELAPYPVASSAEFAPPRLEFAAGVQLAIGHLVPDPALGDAGPRAAVRQAHHDAASGVVAASQQLLHEASTELVATVSQVNQAARAGLTETMQRVRTAARAQRRDAGPEGT